MAAASTPEGRTRQEEMHIIQELQAFRAGLQLNCKHRRETGLSEEGVQILPAPHPPLGKAECSLLQLSPGTQLTPPWPFHLLPCLCLPTRQAAPLHPSWSLARPKSLSSVHC